MLSRCMACVSSVSEGLWPIGVLLFTCVWQAKDSVVGTYEQAKDMASSEADRVRQPGAGSMSTG